MIPLLTSLAVLFTATLGPGTSAQTPAELRVSKTVAIEPTPSEPIETPAGSRTYLFVGPWRCDGDGNVYYVPGIKENLNRPTRVVRIAATGTPDTVFPASLDGGSFADAAVLATSLEATGRLHVLVETGTGESVRQHVVTIPKVAESALHTVTDLDKQQIFAAHVAVLRTGDLFLLGHNPKTGRERRAIQLRVGGRLKDIEARDDDVQEQETIVSSSGDLTWVGTDTEGNAYVVRDSSRRVLAISPAGVVTNSLSLVPPSMPGAKLTGVHLSGRRIAAIYRPEDGVGTWIQVQDLTSGSLHASYGPVQGPVVCYRFDRRDRFTLLSTLGGEWRLLELEAVKP